MMHPVPDWNRWYNHCDTLDWNYMAVNFLVTKCTPLVTVGKTLRLGTRPRGRVPNGEIPRKTVELISSVKISTGFAKDRHSEVAKAIQLDDGKEVPP